MSNVHVESSSGIGITDKQYDVEWAQFRGEVYGATLQGIENIVFSIKYLSTSAKKDTTIGLVVEILILKLGASKSGAIENKSTGRISLLGLRCFQYCFQGCDSRG